MNYNYTGEEVLKEEAKFFCKYIMGEEANEQTIQLYIAANTKLKIEVTPRERRQINHLIDNPGLLPWVDSALAISYPKGGIRRKLFVMFSITESIPAFSSGFLPQARTKKYIYSAVSRLLIALCRIPVGLVILTWI